MIRGRRDQLRVTHPVPMITGSTRGADVLVDCVPYQLMPYTGSLRWSLTDPPAGLSVDPASGRITVARGSGVQASGIPLTVCGQNGVGSRRLA
jgi:hypothetical protein